MSDKKLCKRVLSRHSPSLRSTAVLVGRASSEGREKGRAKGEGTETARRLEREQQNCHVTQANTHQILVHGKHCMEESVLIFIAKVYWLAVSTVPQRERET